MSEEDCPVDGLSREISRYVMSQALVAGFGPREELYSSRLTELREHVDTFVPDANQNQEGYDPALLALLERRAYGQALSTPAKAYMDDVERRQGLVETAGRILMGIGLFGGLAGLIALLLACSMRTRAGRIWSMLRGEGGVEVKHG